MEDIQIAQCFKNLFGNLTEIVPSYPILLTNNRTVLKLHSIEIVFMFQTQSVKFRAIVPWKIAELLREFWVIARINFRGGNSGAMALMYNYVTLSKFTPRLVFEQKSSHVHSFPWVFFSNLLLRKISKRGLRVKLASLTFVEGLFPIARMLHRVSGPL